VGAAAKESAHPSREGGDVEASAKKLKAAYEAGQISPWEYEQESEIIGETGPPDESGRI